MKTKRFILMVAAVLAGAGLAAAGTNDASALLQKGLFEEEANRNLDAAIQAYQAVITQTDKDHQFAATAIFRLGECYRKQGKTNEANAQYQRIVREFSDQAELVKLSREYAGNSVAALPSNQTGLPGLQKQLAALNADVDSYQRQIKILDDMEPEKRRVFAQQHFPNPVLNTLMQDAVKIEQELARKRNDLGDNHPDVQRAHAELKTIYQQIDAQISGIGTDLNQKLSDAISSRDLLEKQIENERKSNALSAPAAGQAVSPAQKEAAEINRLQAMMKDSPDLINGHDGDGETPLHRAVRANQYSVAGFLLDNKADIEAIDSFGRAPLILAAQSGLKEMTELLLERGANVNVTVNKERVARDHMLNHGDNGSTPLHYAALHGYKGVVEALLARGAKPDVKNEDGDTPLHMAARKGFKNVAEALLTGGADVNARDNQGATALFAAVGAGNKAIAELLLSRGAAVNERNNEGQSTLFAAVTVGNMAVVELLLTGKADVNLKTKDGFTPLIAAVNARQFEITRLLLKHGADAKAKMADNHQSTPRWTALDAAVSLNDNESVKLLLDHQADPNATYDLNDVYHRNSTPLLMAAERGQTETAQILLAHKADVNWRNSKGITALLNAVSRDDREMAALLLDKKADTEIKYENRGYTVLHWAVEGQKKEMAELLLAHGAQVNAREDEGKTPLHLAVSIGSRPLVELLLAHGADVNLKDNQGDTALDLAAGQPGSGNVYPIINRGPTPLTYQWQVGGTPSVSGPTNDIVSLLRQHGAVAEVDISTVRTMRQGMASPTIVFRRDTGGYNHPTLFELIAYVYVPPDWNPFSGSKNEPPGLRFPDFGKVRIHRLEKDGQTNILNVALESPLTAGDCTADQRLEWGDVVEIPESDHKVNEKWNGLAPAIRTTLKKCLERTVDIIVKGQTTKLKLIAEAPLFVGSSYGLAPSWHGFDSGGGGRFGLHSQSPDEAAPKAELWSFWLNDVVHGANVILSSSDLTRVKVKRVDPATHKTAEMICNLENAGPINNLWLKDGDVIEIPERQ